jgi:hypothetical protein
MAMKLAFKASTQCRCNKNDKMAVIALGNRVSLTIKHYGHMDPNKRDGRRGRELATMMNVDGSVQ